jgi:putative ABC transport system permease protein
LNFIDFYNLYFVMPLKNIWRNRRRSFITLASVVVGTVVLMLFFGYIKVMEIGLKDEAIHKEYGHLQILRCGYSDDDETSFKYMISKNEYGIIREYLDTLSKVDYVNYRYSMVGLIGTSEASAVYMGIAGEPQSEMFMSPELTSGSFYGENSENQIVIGRHLAKKLKLSAGGEVVLFASNEDGAQDAITVVISGIYKGMVKAVESMQIYLPLQVAHSLLGHDKIHRIIVVLKDEKDTDSVVSGLRKLIKEKNFDLEVRTWSELAVFYRQIIGMFKGITLVVGLIIFFIIMFNISNTMYMVVNDRTKEIGTLRALGNTTRQVKSQLLTEGVLLCLLGCAIGIGITMLIIPIINKLNLTLPPPPGEDDRLPVHIIINYSIIWICVLTSTVTGFFATLLPVQRASKLKIIDALRQF